MSEDIILRSISCLVIASLVALIIMFITERLKGDHLKPYQIGILIVVISVITAIVTGVLRALIGFTSTLSGFVGYLLLTNLLLSRYADRLRPNVIVALITFGLLCIDLPFRIPDFNNTINTFPLLLIVMLGIFAGYLFYSLKKPFGKLSFGVSVVILISIFPIGISKWFNKINYGNFNGDVYQKDVKISAPLVSPKNELVEIKKGKYNILDFWFIGCGVCIEEFPQFQQSYHTYRNNPNVQFYAVNVPMASGDQADPFDFLLKRNFNFPMVINTDSRLVRTFNISNYPTVVILNKEGDMIYKGDIAGADTKLKSLL